MLSVYVPRRTTLERVPVTVETEVPDSAVWFDLVSPTPGEDKIIERRLGIAIPTREEMQEIEVSSRLYVENGARYMTATLMCQSDTDSPKTTPVTFILAGGKLVTVRYDEPRPFAIVTHKLARACPATISGETVLMDLLDAVIDRAADILERNAAEVDVVSHQIFEPTERRAANRSRTYNHIMRSIGRKGDLTSKVRESMVSVGRLAKRDARAAQGDATRRALDLRLRDLSRQQDHLLARRLDRIGDDRAEQHYQDLFGCRRRIDAADADRLDLRHELQEDAGARVDLRLSAGDPADDRRRGSALPLFQMAQVAVKGARSAL
jgi:magnesium transporter